MSVERNNVSVLEHRIPVIDAIRTGVLNASAGYSAFFFGPNSDGQVDYPAVTIDPQQSDYQGTHEYEHTIEVGLVYRYQDSTDYIDDVLTPSIEAVTSIMDELKATPEVTGYIPTQIQDFAPSNQGQRITALVVTFQVATLSDLAETNQ